MGHKFIAVIWSLVLVVTLVMVLISRVPIAAATRVLMTPV